MHYPEIFSQVEVQLVYSIGFFLLGLIVSPPTDLYKACPAVAGILFTFDVLVPWAFSQSPFPWYYTGLLMAHVCIVGFAFAIIGYSIKILIPRLFSRRKPSR